MSNTVAVLMEVKTNLRLPADARGLPARIGATILADESLSNAQKRRKACDLLAAITGELKLKAEQTLACRMVYKQTLEYYLAGQLIGTNGYNQALKKTGWYSFTSIRDIPEFRI